MDLEMNKLVRIVNNCLKQKNGTQLNHWLTGEKGLDEHELKQAVKEAPLLPVRLTLLSDYDCMNSHWFEQQCGGYRYQESYFSDMVDALNLNPSMVKISLTSHGYATKGRFNAYRSRNGKEYVTYEAFYNELINSCASVNQLVILGMARLLELVELDFKVGSITVPKDNRCGIFSRFSGGGSLLGMKLQKDVTFKMDIDQNTGYYLEVDDCISSSSIQRVYGENTEIFGCTVKMHG